MTSKRLRRRSQLLVACLFPGLASAFQAHAIETVGRYSLVGPGPTRTQRDLLSASVRLEFPDSVRTVGQAIETALRTTGYRLSSPANADPARAALLGLPLPIAHRAFGDIPVRRALETLVGPAFKLMEDPVHRLVSFERCGAAPRTLP